MVRAILTLMVTQAPQQPFLATSLLNVLFALSSLDVDVWMDIIEPEFESRFYNLAVACPNEAVRTNACESLQIFYFSLCASSSLTANGHIEQSDSDSENKMEIDTPSSGLPRLVVYLWNMALNCLKLSDRYIAFAGKIFETGANMLRYVLFGRCSYSRDFYRSLSASQPDEASKLLRTVASLSAKSLFMHPVQETVLNNAVDYVTLGWTRILQGVLDLAPEHECDKLLSKWCPILFQLILGPSPVKSSNIFFSPHFHLRLAGLASQWHRIQFNRRREALCLT